MKGSPPDRSTERMRPIATPEFVAWFRAQKRSDKVAVAVLIDALDEHGSENLNRPHAATLKGTRMSNLRELRTNQAVRVFFTVDPEGTPVLLCAGDKSGTGFGKGSEKWYDSMIRQSESLYENYLSTVFSRGKDASERPIGDLMQPTFTRSGSSSLVSRAGSSPASIGRSLS